MIAVPRPDGGITVHGSLQCPYYIHKAHEAGAEADATTGGGRPGGDGRRLRRQGGVPVDDRAARRAAGAKRVGKPVRMIYDRHEDIGATTKRHPAIVRYRSGVTRDGSWSPRTSR